MIRMMVIAGACAGIFLSATVAAQSLYKCTDSQGRNSYQSVACSDHQQHVWTRDMPVASSPSPAPHRVAGPVSTKSKVQPPAARTARSGSGKSSRSRNRGGTTISLHNDPVACEKAKERRRKTYEKLGLKRDFETSRKMDDLVYQACR
ncbi:DUF4124 domain-containing protein [Pseudoxanthomonas sp. UTMC 1351]|uniref:DUF4124 domain-containing protein n=1 Tax=Pseudoxanthomonas sp. UTMC 1351 TaxID=2695853 RepID=UPI0034CF578C